MKTRTAAAARTIALALWAVQGLTVTLSGCAAFDALATTGRESREHEQKQDERQDDATIGGYIGYAIDGLILTALGGTYAIHRRRRQGATPPPPPPALPSVHAPTPPADRPT